MTGFLLCSRLMNMTQSVSVIFGSNIGTTVTSWIIAAVGISVKVKALALPLIGLGALLRLTANHTRRKYIGDALAGFGIFFLGIEILQSTFQNLGTTIDLATFNIGGIGGILLFLGVGVVLTLLMQSSSAAMALVLTAAMSGIITLESPPPATIGTNSGTTSTALLSVIGATHNAKKVAAAHIIFNLVTGLIAILGIPLLLKSIDLVASINGNHSIPTILALFHTAFNVIGVVIFLPFTSSLVSFLDKYMGRGFTELSKPQYLDDNILEAPALAMDALFMELGRLGEMTRKIAQKALTNKFRNKDFIKDRTVVDTLVSAIRQYCVKIQYLDLPDQVAKELPTSLRVIQYFHKTLNIISDVSQEHALLDHQLPGAAASATRAFRREIRDILNVAHTPCSPKFDELEKLMNQLDKQYHELKDELLRIGAQGRLDLTRMVGLLDYYSQMHLMCEQAVKGTTYWATLRDMNITCATADVANQYAWKPE